MSLHLDDDLSWVIKSTQSPILTSDLKTWFSEALHGLKCSPETQAYVLSVLTANVGPLTMRSVVLSYVEALDVNSFAKFQETADWCLWVGCTVSPEKRLYWDTTAMIGQMSYMKCHRLLRRAVPIYEELSSELNAIASEVSKTLSRNGTRLL